MGQEFNSAHSISTWSASSLTAEGLMFMGS